MSLLHEVMDDHSSPLDPLLSIFSRNPVLTEVSVLVIPAEDILREVLHSHACIFLELLLGKFAEVSSNAVVTYTVEDKSVNLRIFACELLQDLDLILLNLWVRWVHHAVVVRLDL